MAASPCFRILLSMMLLWVQYYLASVADAKTLPNITTDRDALLALKARISYDPYSILASNWSTSVSMCNWVGVTCGSRHNRVTILDLSFMGLVGTIPPHVGNLSFLATLAIPNNSFHGSIPVELAHLCRLRILHFRFNNLDGEIPLGMGLLSRLEYLNLADNHFTGTIPSSLSNLTSLHLFALSYNALFGSVPSSFFNLLRMQGIYLAGNKLSGPIPSISNNMPSIQTIDLQDNEMSGGLSTNSFDHLPNLKYLIVSGNQLDGGLPSSLFECKQLQHLSLSFNKLTGRVPKEIGNLIALTYLYLEFNNFEGRLPPEIGNLGMLADLRLQNNNFEGRVPREIRNLIMLTTLYLADNNFEGRLPQEIGNLTALTYLRIGFNNFEGLFLPNLQQIFLFGNELSGTIPSSISNASQVTDLDLAQNSFSGSIPKTLGNLRLLQWLNLEFNKLTVESTEFYDSFELMEPYIPLGDQLVIKFSNGSLSAKVGNMKVLTQLDLSTNQLSGGIPMTIGGLKDLVVLYVSNNRLEGAIPQSFGELVSLVILELCNNSFSGEIPKSLEALSYLKYLNVSFNRLRGEVPMGGSFVNFTIASFMSNDALCGAPRLQLPLCDTRVQKNTSKHILKFILPTISLTILALVLVLVWTRCIKRNAKSTLFDAELSPLAQWRRISQQELIQATDGFSLNNLLGEGSFGSVYKGTLSDGMNIATKVLNLQVEAAFKSFDVESEVLRNVRHRNLLKIISVCSNTDFKALVLEYMPNGSLEKWLHSNNHFLNILQRLNIVIDVASALEYLHHGYCTSIVHCDLKPSNVLLDEDMSAHVADFGISKLLGDGDSRTWTITLATIGYMAPEYGSHGIVSTRGDMYSFGILLMETFTRKRPTDDMFIGEMSLKHWVDVSLPHAVIDIIDPNLLRNERDDDAVKECISSLMGLAMGCCAESPEQRTNIVNVSATLNKIKLKLLKDIGQS
ncbi:hypothetical protein CJ030_MR3G025335 [Morella rubra]|uniref:non-specific serine/threonine protein kinase n=1 Tax=Morella rubra TaxID=262757 RepID=A0A6A1W6S4_9ROSI|nr:hypothetical protein CJ030_MR3G025335 [Morella rubra]